MYRTSYEIVLLRQISEDVLFSKLLLKDTAVIDNLIQASVTNKSYLHAGACHA